MAHKTPRGAKVNSGESEQTFSLLFESHPIPMFVYDLKTLMILEVNDAMVEKYGYSRNEFQSLALKDIVPAQDMKKKQPDLPYSGEWRYQCKDGRVIDVDITSHILKLDGRQTALVTAQDATQHKLAQVALRAAEENHRSIFENATVGIYQSTPQGRFLKVNPAMSRIFGYDSPEEMLENIVSIEKQHYVDPADRRKFQRLMSEHGEVCEFSNWKYRKDGSLIWIQENACAVKDAGGNTLRYEGFITDITAQKQTIDALRESEERYRQLMQLSLEPIYMFDSQTMRILEVNPAFEKILGYTAGEIEKMTAYDVVAHDQKSIERLTNQIKTFGATDIGERQWRRKDGTVFPVHVTANKMTVKGADVIFITARDITAQKQAEEGLQRAKESLELANRELEHVLVREQQLARTDGLTGLYNYRYFFELATREFSASMRYQRPLAILMFDTDDFKQVNDTLGHTAGDKILTLVAQTAAAQMRGVDVLARYGGDEFVILLSQTSAPQAFPIAERIRMSVAALSMQTAKSPFTVTLSIGIAELWREPADETVESIVQRADQALYIAKQTGRNRTVIFGPHGTGKI